MTGNIARANFRSDQYPITIRAFRSDNGQEVWKKVIDLPNEGPVCIAIPALKLEQGVKVRCRVEFADGTTEEG